ncbi:MAG: GNAT family N-acetyltransferase [Glaciimonas sp.]|nr:GNAT family N-acetyltransferase [Glaciimonas sp.]
MQCSSKNIAGFGEVVDMKRADVIARYVPICDPIGCHKSNRSIEPDGITISCYENDVPEFIEADLDRIYGSLYSSLVQFSIYCDSRDTNTYIVRKGGKIITIFLFQCYGYKVRVINEVISVSEEDMSRFTAYIFINFIAAKVIFFTSIQTNIRTLPFPYQRVKNMEYTVLTLPKTGEEYLDSLGKSARRNIQRYIRNLSETFPSFRFELLVKDEIDDQTIRAIIALNRARVDGKSTASATDQAETEKIICLAKKCGLVGVARINGQVCAGSISFRTGSNYFFRAITHDPMYDAYWIGFLCCYLTFCECIVREAKELHFMWGDCEYKYSPPGVKRDLDKVAVYRSNWQMLCKGDIALKIAFRGYLRQLMAWLHNAKRRDGFVP